MTRILVASLLIAITSANAFGQEAVDWQGKRQRGEPVQDAGKWVFRGADGKQRPITQIAYIRFEQAATPLPKSPLTHTLHLPHDQKIAGMLHGVDAQHVEFTTSWGQHLKLKRDQVIGIEQSRNARMLLRDDFEQALKPWQLVGEPSLDRERKFAGKASMLLDQPKQRATRTWTPALTEGDVRLYFFDEADTMASFDIVANENKATRIVQWDINGYACPAPLQSFGVLKRSAGWHLLAIEVRAGRLRVYIDDACLGEGRIGSLQGIRMHADAGKLWCDEFIVTQRLDPLTPPTPVKDYDTVWLTHGEQLFGKLVNADLQAVTLESKLGKRAISWSQARGILFAQSKWPKDTNDAEVTFRPGPGFPLDQLRAKLVRWENGKLVIQQEPLGEIALERDRLDKIRWLAK